MEFLRYQTALMKALDKRPMLSVLQFRYRKTNNININALKKLSFEEIKEILRHKYIWEFADEERKNWW